AEHQRGVVAAAGQAERAPVHHGEAPLVRAPGEADVPRGQVHAGIAGRWEARRELAGPAAEVEEFAPADIAPGHQFAGDHLFFATKAVFDDAPEHVPGLRTFGETIEYLFEHRSPRTMNDER